MELITRTSPATDTRPRRIFVSNGQGTAGQMPWDSSATSLENHLAAAVTFAREMFGLTPAVVSSYSVRRSADGYNVTLSRYTEEA